MERFSFIIGSGKNGKIFIVEFSGVNSPLTSIAAHFELLPLAHVLLYLFP